MASPTVKFLHGDSVVMVDHTPSSAVKGGDVIVTGNVPYIAHNDIDADRLGAVAAGGGVYECPKESGSGTAIAGGKKVFWDAGNDRVTETEGSNKVFGYTTEEGSSDDDTKVNVVHDPRP